MLPAGWNQDSLDAGSGSSAAFGFYYGFWFRFPRGNAGRG